jgi:hypothetical protein
MAAAAIVATSAAGPTRLARRAATLVGLHTHAGTQARVRIGPMGVNRAEVGAVGAHQGRFEGAAHHLKLHRSCIEDGPPPPYANTTLWPVAGAQPWPED